MAIRIKTNDAFGDKHKTPICKIDMGLATQMIFWNEGFCRQLLQMDFGCCVLTNRDISAKVAGWTKQKHPGSFAFLSNGLIW